MIYLIHNSVLPSHMLTLVSQHPPLTEAHVKLSEITFRYFFVMLEFIASLMSSCFIFVLMPEVRG